MNRPKKPHKPFTPEFVHRFMSHVERMPSGCWQWTGTIQSRGYGAVSYHSQGLLAHRVAHEICRGPIPDALVIDHLCRNRGCVNPDHMEVVTAKENILRGIGRTAVQAKQTHCKRGHAFDDANTYLYRGLRCCRACRRMHDRNNRARKRHEAEEQAA